MRKAIGVTAVFLCAAFLGHLDSQGRPSPLDKYLRPATITQMDWKLHLLDEQLTEALRSGRIEYRSSARYTFAKEIHLTFSVPPNEFREQTETTKRERLMRIVNLASTLLSASFPEFDLSRDLYVGFIPVGNPEIVFAEYRKGAMRFPPPQM